MNSTQNTILVLRDRRRGGTNCIVRYMQCDKHGRELHRELDCRTLEEAQAEAMDVNRRIFHGAAQIKGLINS